jgi:hypothetical protein
VGSVLLVLGVVCILVGLQRPEARVRRVGPNRIVNTDRPGINAHNSPAVAVNPSRPQMLAVADRIDTPRQSCSARRSSDGGATWAQPLALGDCFWPDVAFDGAGNLLVLTTTLGGRFNQPVGVWLQRFDGAAPSGPPVQVAGSEAYHARLAVDGERVVVTWVQAGPAAALKPLGFPPPPNPVVLTGSNDGGRSFSAPVRVSEPTRPVVQPRVVLGPGGRVVVGALDLGADLFDYEGRHEGQGGPPDDGRWALVSWTSTDGGATFAPASTVAADLVIPQRIYSDLAPTPGLALDGPRDRLFATWDAGRGDGRDVFLARSDDGGATWSAPAAVAARPGAQFLPTVGVSADGRVDVLFYDRSRDRNDVVTEVALASSWDGGRSFTTGTVSDRSFDSRIGFGSAQGIPMLGSQLAVVSEPDRSLAFWSDTRNATVDDNAQDLAMADVAIRARQGRRWPMLALGGVLLLLGASLVLRPPPEA